MKKSRTPYRPQAEDPDPAPRHALNLPELDRLFSSLSGKRPDAQTQGSEPASSSSDTTSTQGIAPSETNSPDESSPTQRRKTPEERRLAILDGLMKRYPSHTREELEAELDLY
jgi:hypothetical protein